MNIVAVLGVTTTLLLAPALADSGTGGSVLTCMLAKLIFIICMDPRPHGACTGLKQKCTETHVQTDATVDLLSGYLRGQVSELV